MKKIIPVNTPVITKSDAIEVYKVVKSGWVSSAGSKILDFEEKLSKQVNRKVRDRIDLGLVTDNQGNIIENPSKYNNFKD